MGGLWHCECIVLLTLHVSWMNSNKPRLHLAGLPGPGLMGGWLLFVFSPGGFKPSNLDFDPEICIYIYVNMGKDS